MEANKASNVMQYENEIFARPAKTWFQNEKERKQSSEAAERIHKEGEPVEEKKLNAKERKKLARTEKKAAKKEDPFKGLCRKKKRKKMMRMEAEEEAREFRQEAREAQER